VSLSVFSPWACLPFARTELTMTNRYSEILEYHNVEAGVSQMEDYNVQ